VAVSRGRPCLVCGNVDWCRWSQDGAHCCMRAHGVQVAGLRLVSKQPGKHGGCVYRVVGELSGAAGWSAEDQARKDAEKAAKFAEQLEKAKKLWADASPVHPAIGQYFEGRGVRVSDMPFATTPRSLRLVSRLPFYEAVKEPERQDGGKPGSFTRCAPSPAIVAAVVDKAGQLQTLHRIWLDELSVKQGNARKRSDVEKAKKLLGSPTGAAVRIRRDAAEQVPAGWPLDVTRTLVLCEGVETGVALAAATRCTVWACVSGSGLAAFQLSSMEADPVHGWVRTLIIAGDHDKRDQSTGQRPGKVYARLAANRAVHAFPHMRVIVGIPEGLGLVGEAEKSNAEGAEGSGGARSGIDEGRFEGEVLVEGYKSVDWEDVYKRCGARAVVEGLAGGQVWAGGEGVENSNGKSQSANPEAGTSAIRNPQSDISGEGGGGGSGGGGEDADGEASGSPPGLVAPAGDLRRARCVLGARFTPRARSGERYTLCYDYKGEQWLRYVGTKYEPITAEQVRSGVLDFFEPWWVRLKPRKGDTEARYKKLGMTSGAAASVSLAMQADTGVVVDELPVWAPPSFDADGVALWEEDSSGPPPEQHPEVVVPLSDGLWSVDHWVRGEVLLLPHTPRYLATTCRDFTLPWDELERCLREDPRMESLVWELAARLAPNFMKAVSVASDGDPEWVKCYGRCVGISFTPWTFLERIPWLWGPPGTFKGTLSEGHKAALGEDLFASTSAMEISRPFEYASWRGKRVVEFTDASLPRYSDPIYVVEQLKKISGGDRVGVDVKHQAKDSGWKPRVHLWIYANDILAFPDPSLSLVRRLVCLPTAGGGSASRQFKDDSSIKEGVKREGAGILLWGMCHLRELMEDVRAKRPPIVMPEKGRMMMAKFKRQAARVHAFLEDIGVRGPEEECEANLLRALYKAWCEAEGLQAMSAERFGAELQSLVAGAAREAREQSFGGERHRWKVYTGIRPRLKGEDLEKPETVMKGVMVVRPAEINTTPVGRREETAAGVVYTHASGKVMLPPSFLDDYDFAFTFSEAEKKGEYGPGEQVQM
jgi:hypothetical protein